MKLKDIIYLLFVLLSAACSRDDESIGNEIYLQQEDIVHGKFIRCLSSHNLTSKEFEESLPDIPEKEKIMFSSIFRTKTIRVNAISYNTKAAGKSINASGVAAYPLGIEPRGVIFFPFYFIGSSESAPSKQKSIIAFALSYLGYIVISADYIGMGTAEEYIVPYAEKDIVGRTCTDMFLAAQDFLLSKNIKVHKKHSIIGYSYGAVAAIAVHQFMESKYPCKIKIEQTYAAGGMYAPVETLNYYMENPVTGYPQALPFIILDVNHWNNLNLKLENIFKEPLLSTYKELLLSKKHTSKYINEQLTSNIRNFLTDKFLDAGTVCTERQKIKEVLAQNNLCEFTPSSPIYIYHSKDDSYVPFLNAEILYRNLKERGAEVEFVITQDKHLVPKRFLLDIFKKFK